MIYNAVIYRHNDIPTILLIRDCSSEGSEVFDIDEENKSFGGA